MGKTAPRGASPQIAQSCRIAHGTVANYLLRAEHAGLTWPLPEHLSDSALENLLFAKGVFHGKHSSRAEPEWEKVHLELKKKGVTLYLLWDEYRQSHENSLGYSSFTDRYRAYRKTITPVTLRQRAGPTGCRFAQDRTTRPERKLLWTMRA